MPRQTKTSPSFGNARLAISSLPLSIALFSILLWTPGIARAQASSRTPDPAALTLTAQDVPGWTQTQGVRHETWSLDNPGAATAPSSVGDEYDFESDFARDTPDGRHLVLTTMAIETSPNGVDAQFQGLQHSALGQTPIGLPPLGDQSLGWWENQGDTRSATAAASIGAIVVQLRLTGVTPADQIIDETIGAWLSDMVQRTDTAPDVGSPNWTGLVPGGDVAPWLLVLDSGSVGSDWNQTSGLELWSNEMGVGVQSLSAARTFNRSAPFQRSVTSTVSAFSSPDSAMALGMSGPGSSVPAPTLGDQATEFKTVNSGGGRDAPTVTYTVNVRRGAVVTSVQETGVTYSLDSAAEAESLASAADARVASVLSQ